MTTPASPTPAAEAPQPEAAESESQQLDEQAAELEDSDAADADDEAADDAEQDDADDEGGTKGKASRQAARLRVQLRESRDQNVTLATEMGQLEDRLQAQQRAVIVQTVAAARFADPAGFARIIEASGVELDSLLNADGLVDPAKVREAIAATTRALRTSPRPVPGQGGNSDSGGAVRLGDLLSEAAGIRAPK